MKAFAKPCDGFGLETKEVDLAQLLSGVALGETSSALFAGQLPVLRGQRLDRSQFHAFARRFGQPEPHVIDQFHPHEIADILMLSNVRKDGAPLGLADAGTYFHGDHSYFDVPARATMLHSIQAPKQGGNTMFANQYAA